MPLSACVADGDWVLLVLSAGDRRLVRVRSGGKTSAGKQQCPVDPIVGAPFGANFRIEPRDGLVRDERTVEEISGSVGETFADVVTAQAGASNAELFDDGNAQQLSDYDIQELKRKGTHGAELVKAIAQSSSTLSPITLGNDIHFSDQRCRSREHSNLSPAPPNLVLWRVPLHPHHSPRLRGFPLNPRGRRRGESELRVQPDCRRFSPFTPSGWCIPNLDWTMASLNEKSALNADSPALYFVNDPAKVTPGPPPPTARAPPPNQNQLPTRDRPTLPEVNKCTGDA